MDISTDNNYLGTYFCSPFKQKYESRSSRFSFLLHATYIGLAVAQEARLGSIPTIDVPGSLALFRLRVVLCNEPVTWSNLITCYLSVHRWHYSQSHHLSSWNSNLSYKCIFDAFLFLFGELYIHDKGEKKDIYDTVSVFLLKMKLKWKAKLQIMYSENVQFTV